MCVCVCVLVGKHGNDALAAAVARAIVLIHSLNVLIYCGNESENERLREGERIIMFPPFVSPPSIKPEERQPEHMSTYPLKARQQ